MKKTLVFLALALTLTATACGQTGEDEALTAKPAEQISEVSDGYPQYSVECFMEKCSPEEKPKYAVDDAEQKNRIVSLYNKAVNESTEIEFDSGYDILSGGEMPVFTLTEEDGTVITVQLQAVKNYDEDKLQRGNILCLVGNSNEGFKQEDIEYSSYRCDSKTYNELYSELENVMSVNA
ncbi:hypothetical protein [Ruminococcus sp. Marseille-P6503]|uniref:hypothetical protein n=1 Tax=Ruminococcus sp. Marseille-P6503 TaxID=2364796 RepID=UPI000F525B1D|nr:hypothetical protein [Ruminococcus sp. Marseille-P6503]